MLNITSLSARLAPADFLSEDDGPAAKPYRIKICNVANRRVKDVEISVPVVRTIAFYLVERPVSLNHVGGQSMYLGQQMKILEW
ncbi:hypothetical protein GH714_015872 [Hevea brasiliensis]|uniref:Uncharacterized protein n=1 Tax=Hevea brasiliensis TaxID=3981 RepID=A0A6A6KPE1_HEVBR|nr:hypothetical protein GH714_015772 [Hevea brasiliensis]KAF2290863.1 hypothetical protein GH714_015872 [Hevea brasiliensis]